MSTVLLSQEDIRKVMDLKEVVEITEKTFKGFGEGTTINPTKVGLDLGETAAYPPYQGFMNAMPAYVGWNDVAGIKWAGGFLGERKKMGLPYITSLILLINPKIGNFTAVMDGEWITTMRTGAQTAVSLKYLHKGASIRRGSSASARPASSRARASNARRCAGVIPPQSTSSTAMAARKASASGWAARRRSSAASFAAAASNPWGVETSRDLETGTRSHPRTLSAASRPAAIASDRRSPLWRTSDLRLNRTVPQS